MFPRTRPGMRAELLRGPAEAFARARSVDDNSGIRAYIITMPDANHAMKSREPAMPSQRCRKTTTRRQSGIVPRSAKAVGLLSLVGVHDGVHVFW